MVLTCTVGGGGCLHERAGEDGDVPSQFCNVAARDPAERRNVISGLIYAARYSNYVCEAGGGGLGGGGERCPYHISHLSHLQFNFSSELPSILQQVSDAELGLALARASPYYNPISTPKPRKGKSPRRRVISMYIAVTGRTLHSRYRNNFNSLITWKRQELLSVETLGSF